MSDHILFTVDPADRHSFDLQELIDALQNAQGAARTDGNSSHYVCLANGNGISRIQVREETLSDGSKACTVELFSTED